MELGNIVSLDESLGRYLLESNRFNAYKRAVLPKAFMPPSDLRLSVFRIGGLQEEEIWEIGQKNVIDTMKQPKVLYGIADIKVSKVQENGLEVDADDKPKRHANIIGWPQEISKQMSIAQELAAEAKLKLK